MNCRKVTHLLSAYMDGELPGIESLQIRDHLRQCSDCAGEYDDLLGMKRLLGRLKIQEPAADIAVEILQSIRIEGELRAERSPAARLSQFTESLRMALVTPRALGLGFGVVAIAAFLYMQPISDNQVRVVGVWDHSVPPASEFTSGVNYGNSGQFVSPSVRSNMSGSSFETVSFGSGIQGFRQPPPQIGENTSYFAGSH